MSQLDVKLFIWNVRGLNSPAKRDCVRNLVFEAGSTIVCLQESKLQNVDSAVISHAIGPRFANNFAFLPASGTRGGIILACDENFFTLDDVMLGSYSL
jgi:exonuclease III